MKKLLFAIAGAAAFSAFAADPSPRTGDLSDIDVLGFENFDLTSALVSGAVVNRTDTGIEGQTKWSCSGEDASLVKTYGGDNAAKGSNLVYPEPFSDEGDQYLALDTNGSELQRAIGVPVAAHGTYIDTLVQFTPSESAPTTNDLTGAKLAIWLGVVNNVTNLYVQGGYYDESGEVLSATSQAYALNKSCEPGQWYRLTVKAYSTIGNAAATEGETILPAFTILIDGEEVAATTPVYSNNALVYLCPGEGDGSADQNYLDADTLALFKAGKIIPSLDATFAAGTLTTVGFKGTGALDDFVVTNIKPTNLGPAAIDFTLTWPAGLTAVSYTVGNGEPVAITGSSPLAIPNLVGGEAITFIVQNADGAQKTLSATAADGEGIDATGATFTWADYLGAAVNGAYEIDNLAELILFQKGVATNEASANAPQLATVGLTFKLTDDIALTAPWPGIGVQNGKDIYSTETFNGAAFQGTFDGQNHTISGFQMIGKGDNPVGLDYCGFFNSTYGATIQNLKIQYAGSLFAADTTSGTKESGATFVGVAKNSTLRNLTTVAGTVSCSKGFGGIVGYLTSGTLVDSCTNNVNMTSLAPNKCGGIAMITQGGSAVTICNCQNNGSVAGSGEIGSAIGYIGLDTTISNFESTVAYKMFQHQGSTVTLQGTIKGNATVDSYTGQATPGLNFATVEGSVATFVADGALAAGNTYRAMHAATATYEFAAAGSISFDTTLFTPTYAITAAEGLTLEDPVSSGSVTTYTATSQGVDIEPGQQTTPYTTQADATAALANVSIVEPDDVKTNETITAQAKADYVALFEAKVVEVTGGYAIEVGLTAAAEETLQTQADNDAAEIVDAIDDDEVTFNTTPGLYYSIEYGTSLSLGSETEKVMATGSTLTLDMPAKSGNSGFYKVKISITK